MTSEPIIWDKTARENFEAVLAKIPVFLRSIAAEKVSQRAEEFARKRLAQNDEPGVSPKDVVDAFFIETPFGFHGPMKMDMKALGIDYEKFGH